VYFLEFGAEVGGEAEVVIERCGEFGVGGAEIAKDGVVERDDQPDGRRASSGGLL